MMGDADGRLFERGECPTKDGTRSEREIEDIGWIDDREREYKGLYIGLWTGASSLQEHTE